MSKNNKNKKRKNNKKEDKIFSDVHSDVKKNISVVIFLGLAIIFILAAAGQAGPVGNRFYEIFEKIFGLGYFLLPVTSFILAFSFILPEERKLWKTTISGALLFIISALGFIDIVSPGSGGLTGEFIGSLEKLFGTPASIIITLVITIASLLIILNKPFKISSLKKSLQNQKEKESEKESIKFGVSGMGEEDSNKDTDTNASSEKEKEVEVKAQKEELSEEEDKEEKFALFKKKDSGDYVPPPLSLFDSKSDKPTAGDLKANANIVKRTLESFGIPVEMGEVQIGPTVTRYTLKPAEGVKLSRITALGSDLALALAAHPIRIEAPIPGKSLVGIEIPNKSAALVRLGNLISYKDFQQSPPLSFALGRGVSGEPVFANIAKMPHLLVAGSTGSGKSISIHSLILSLIFKNSPNELRLVMVDPKRVELSVYDGIPHLISPVITENKKAVGALKWTVGEMERRYQVLLDAGARDIESFNRKSSERMPYILLVIDELADLMASYGREVEGAIVRLAQLSRAVGVHLVVSTQRPSVEVITGLIKANITSRIALQVASGIDSRTILDSSGAEKLLGNGDLLFISSEFSKPRRIQGCFVTEKELKKVVEFIKKNNSLDQPSENIEGDEEKESLNSWSKQENRTGSVDFDSFENEEEDELYPEAIEVIKKTGKASASLLQRRLRVGYARAARLLDVMEEQGIIGPSQGSKPREVYLSKEEEDI